MRWFATLRLLLGLGQIWARGQLLAVEVQGASMRPGLLEGDRLICVRGRNPHPGDVIVRDTGTNTTARFQVKRFVASGGQTWRGVVVADGRCWIEGDNAGASGDSRHFGSVPAHELIAVGVAVLRAGRLLPVDQAGTPHLVGTSITIPDAPSGGSPVERRT